MEMKNETHQHSKQMNVLMYKKLAVMILLSFVAMYILMYAMVDKLANVVPNVNQFYMAGLMTMPMLAIELLVMSNMYMKKKLNIILLSAGVAGMVIFFLCIHQQAGVKDKQFLKSMIPHHAAAVLMVEKASLTDPEIKELANKIITSQQAEIRQMKDKLKELDK
jgi:uncharacterized protein (DUF305 family)